MNAQKLCKYFKMCLELLPNSLESFDTSRIIILQFSLSGLDILNKLDEISETRKQEIIEWIYSLQIVTEDGMSGFRGGYFPSDHNIANKNYMSCHATMTYSCLACLTILGDDLARVQRPQLAKSLRRLQSPDGCFSAAIDCPEADVRFVYSAVIACFFVGDLSLIQRDTVVKFVLSAQNHDGGFGQRPLQESHGGSTFCALASLQLLGCLDEHIVGERRQKLLHWLMLRQREGFHGRPHKEDDSCYTFWVGASLKMLGHEDLVDVLSVVRFLEETHDEVTGGFCKLKGCKGYADPMHTYLSLAGLSSLVADGISVSLDDDSSLSEHTRQLLRQLEPIEPVLNLTRRTAARLDLQAAKLA